MEFGEMATESAVTTQVSRHQPVHLPFDFQITDVEGYEVYDRHGASVPFQTLYQQRKCIIIFLRVRRNHVLVID